MTSQDPLELIQASLGKRNAQKKAINILACLVIVFLGITATIYKVRYEGGFWTCFREMTVCATALTTITSAALIIPLLTIGSFVFTDSPIGKLSPKYLYILIIYTVSMLTLILAYVIPENKIPYSFLDIRHQPVWYILLAFIVVYGSGYLLSWMFSWLNLKLSWIWYSNVAREKGSGQPA